jgi:diadenylate cyclase
MRAIWDYIVHFFSLFKMITVFDVIDILCVTAVFFAIYLFIKERRAGKLALGVGIIFVLLIICQLLSLTAMQYLLSHVIEVGIVLLVVIFQPEIRSALEKLGDSSIKGIKVISEQKGSTQTIAMIDEIATATFELAKSKTGALIVFERTTRLGDIIRTGTTVDALASTLLLGNIFFNKAPLHDGAVIIRNGRVHSAGCFLPLSESSEIGKQLGTRHRAAIGMSENSDAIVLVISEENGIISVAKDGELKRGFNRTNLENYLNSELIKEEKRGGKKLFKSKKEGNDDNR